MRPPKSVEAEDMDCRSVRSFPAMSRGMRGCESEEGEGLRWPMIEMRLVDAKRRALRRKEELAIFFFLSFQQEMIL